MEKFFLFKKKQQKKGSQGNNLKIVPRREGGWRRMRVWEGYMVMGKHKEKNKNSALAIESCPVGLKHTAQLYSFGLG